MTDTIAHPPLPEAAAHMLARDLAAFKTAERTATAFSVAVSTPDDGRSEPLFTAQQMRDYRDAPAWLPIATAPKGKDVLLLRASGRIMIADWGRYYQSNQPRFTHWQSLPEPIEQATGEKK